MNPGLCKVTLCAHVYVLAWGQVTVQRPAVYARYLQSIPTLFFEAKSHKTWDLLIWLDWLASVPNPNRPAYGSPVLGLQMYTATPVFVVCFGFCFLMWVQESNSGFPACAASTPFSEHVVEDHREREALADMTCTSKRTY